MSSVVPSWSRNCVGGLHRECCVGQVTHYLKGTIHDLESGRRERTGERAGLSDAIDGARRPGR